MTETLDAAKRRAVEPDHLDATAYGGSCRRRLSVTYPEISISNDLLRNVAVTPLRGSE